MHEFTIIPFQKIFHFITIKDVFTQNGIVKKEIKCWKNGKDRGHRDEGERKRTRVNNAMYERYKIYCILNRFIPLWCALLFNCTDIHSIVWWFFCSSLLNDALRIKYKFLRILMVWQHKCELYTQKCTHTSVLHLEKKNATIRKYTWVLVYIT